VAGKLSMLLFSFRFFTIADPDSGIIAAVDNPGIEAV